MLSSFDKKVFEALKHVEDLPDEFKSWLWQAISRSPNVAIQKSQITNVMGENFREVGATGQPAYASWQSYGAGFGGAKFYKDYLGIVHVTGLVSPSVNPGSTRIFTLPAGYRPAVSEMFYQQGHNGAYVGVRLDIGANGDINVTNPANTTFTGVGTHYVSLAGIHFRAA